MKIKKNGKVINLTESDLKRIVKKVLSEGETCLCPDGTLDVKCCNPKVVTKLNLPDGDYEYQGSGDEAEVMKDGKMVGITFKFALKARGPISDDFEIIDGLPVKMMKEKDEEERENNYNYLISKGKKPFDSGATSKLGTSFKPSKDYEDFENIEKESNKYKIGDMLVKMLSWK